MSSDAAPDARRERIADVLSSCSDRLNAGGTIDIPSILAEHADLLPELQLALEAIDRAPVRSRDRLELEALGSHRIVREIGRGGMGIVYEAVDLSLGRRVALKILPGSKTMDPSRRERFLREARAAARLHHTRIVPVFEVGEAEGILFYAMQHIAGCGLDRVIRELRYLGLNARPSVPEGQPAADRDGAAASIARKLVRRGSERFLHSAHHHAAARIGSEIADALSHAHGQGILHRDVKPSNVILDADGSAWLVDFGLAKSEMETASLTQSGDVVGTVAYMPPERLRGEGDHRGDVYSLGATLYEMLALRPAFEESDRHRLYKKILAEDPPPLSRVAPAVPRVLETIVQKAMAREPSRRYPTAAALRDDLDRFLRGEPIQARPTRTLERSLLWCRRNPIVSSLGGAIVLLLSVLLAIATFSARRLSEQLYEAELSRAQARRASGQPGRRFETLAAIERAARIRPSDALRDEAIAALSLADVREIATPSSPVSVGAAKVFDSDLERYATLDPQRGRMVIRRVLTGEELQSLGDPQVRETPRVFSPDGLSLASSFDQGGKRFFRLRSLAAGEILLERETHPRHAAYAFGEAGVLLACGEPDGSIALLDLASRAVRRTFRPRVPAQWIGIAQSTRRLLSFGPPGEVVEVFDLEGDRALDALEVPTGVYTATLSADGRLLATGPFGGTIHLWRTDTAEHYRALTGHLGGGVLVAFSPSGGLLASTSWDGTLRLWDPWNGDLLLTKSIAGGTPRWSRDGARLLLEATDRVPLLGVDAGAERRVLRSLDAPESVGGGGSQFHSGSRLLLTSWGLWDVARDEELKVRALHRSLLDALFHPDGRSVVVTRPSGVFRCAIELTSERESDVLRLGAAEVIATLPPGTGSVAFDGSGRTLAAVEPSSTVVVLNWDGPQAKRVLGAHPGADHLSVSADGALLASGTYNRGHGVKVWDLRSGQLLQELDAETGAHGYFDPRGRWLAVVTPSEYRFRRLGRSGSEAWAMEHVHRRKVAAPVLGPFAWTPDGAAAAVEDALGEVLLLDPATGRHLGRLESSQRRPVLHLEFSADTRFLAAWCANASVELWDLRRIRDGLQRLGLDLEPPSLAPFTLDSAVGASRPLRVEVSEEPAADAEAALDSLRNPRQLASVALALQRRGEWNAAIQRYAQALKLEPDSAGALNNLAWALIVAPEELRDPQRALVLSERAVKAGGEHRASLNTLGAAQFRAGNPRAAIDTLLRGARLGAGVTAWDGFFIAMSLKALGFDSLARDYFAGAVRWIDRHPELTKDEARELESLRREAAKVLAEEKASPAAPR